MPRRHQQSHQTFLMCFYNNVAHAFVSNQVREYSNRIDEPPAMASMAHGIAAAGARYKLNAAGEGFLEPLLANTEGLDSDSGKISVKYCHYFWGNLNLGFLSTTVYRGK